MNGDEGALSRPAPRSARSYRTTTVSAAVTHRDGEASGALPGRLVRGPQAARRRLGRGLIIPDPDAGGGESNGGQEVSGEFVESGGDASEVLELVEEALDEVALPVEIAIDRSLDLDVALGRDMGLPTSGADQVDQRSRVVPAICDEGSGRRQGLDQARCHGLVGGLAGREQQSDRQSLFVDNGVDLGAQSSTRTANGVIRTPFLPPAACWWARTIELSMNCSDCGERAARASKMCSHTPALAQRL